MSILVFGQTGQVARELCAKRDVIALGRDQADLSDPAACGDIIRQLRPDAVINAAAYTAVDQAEGEEALAAIINGDAPGEMARVAGELDIPFLHISTDYVFDGKGESPWLPGDEPCPVGAYGRTKLAGERAVASAGGRHAVLRTSWVFSAHGNNFVKTMLRLGAERDELSVVADQIGGPTSAGAIAGALLEMADQFVAGAGTSGIYHFAGAPAISWAGFAREIFAQAGMDVMVNDIASSAYPTPAKRPLNSRMDCGDLARIFGITEPDWRVDLAAVLKNLGK